MGKLERTFAYSDDLINAQRALAAVQAERRTCLATLPAWSGDIPAVAHGLDEEQLAESARLGEADRQASHAVWAEEYRAGLPVEDRVEDRSRLHHIDAPAEGSGEAARA
ncbi:hypothetical protein [Kitasatospora sp. NPDC096140]|uniref:hypothetical protein n=1 Tax=Kitasatospora sp. NPDC096140 TaxID=3155425 RepID=UPI00331F4016